jgi:hypothetical protein
MGNSPDLLKNHIIDRCGLIFSALANNCELARWAGSYGAITS